MKYNQIRDNIIDILNSMDYLYKMYNDSGAVTSNPYEARYFFVDNPNIMVIVDDESNTIELHRANFNFELFKKLLKMFRNVTRKYFVKLHVSTYNTSITPKTFSRDVLRRKTNKIISLGENVSYNYVDSIEKRVILEDVITNAYVDSLISEATYSVAMKLFNSEVDHSKRINHLINTIIKQRE